MPYTMREVSKMLDIPATTIRYYEKEGLLPFIERKESGYRSFSDVDVSMLNIIECLKKTGMSIKEIKQFSKWVEMGDASLKERYDMFLERKKCLQAQIDELQATMDIVDHKCMYYKTALEAGTEKIHINILKNEDIKQVINNCTHD